MIRPYLAAAACGAFLCYFALDAQQPPQPATEQYDSCHCAEAARRIERLALQGDAAAMRYMGIVEEDGLAAPRSYVQALSWYRRASAAGDRAATIRLGALLRRLGQEEEAAAVLERDTSGPAAASALYELGLIESTEGRATPPDFPKARRLFEQSAKAGSLAGSRELGWMLVKGIGGEKEENQGRELLKLAAQRGDGKAALLLGDLSRDSADRLEAGIVAPSFFERAGQNGAPEGYLRAAAMFEGGRVRGLGGSGYSPIYERILGWYGKAAQSGNKDVVLTARAKLVAIAQERDLEAKKSALFDLGELQLDSSGVTLKRDSEENAEGIRLCLKNEARPARVASIINHCSIGLGNVAQGEILQGSCEWVAAGWSYFQPGQCKWLRQGAFGVVDAAVEYKEGEKWEPGMFADEPFQEDCGTNSENFLLFTSKRMGKECLGERILYNMHLVGKAHTNLRISF